MGVRSHPEVRGLTFWLLFVFLFTSPSFAANHYINPAGSDSGDCTNSGSPCKTFSYALAAARMPAGDTLILQDGTYTRSNSGNGTRILSIDCNNGFNNGSANSLITVKADHARLAYLHQDGTGAVLYMSNCQYWAFQDIRSDTGDMNANINSEGHWYVRNSSHINFQRMLAQYNNRYRNESPFTFDNSNYNLVEDTEIYDFARLGIVMSSSSYNVMRRNYINSRNRADCVQTGCNNSSAIDSTKGDVGISIYPGSYNIIENNIVEATSRGFDIQGAGYNGVYVTSNSYYGNISNGNSYSLLIQARGTTDLYTPTNISVNNFAGLGGTIYGMYLRDSRNTQLSGVSMMSNASSGIGIDRDGCGTGCYNGNPPLSVGMVDVLAVSNAGNSEYYADNSAVTTITGNYFNEYSNGHTHSTTGSWTHVTTSDPQLGGCKVWIPSASPMHGAGLSGSDVGANILYEYINGVLTNTPLWSASTNHFMGCGVQVTGVNDSAGNSCINVDSRLNVNAGGCSFPAGYGSTEPATIYFTNHLLTAVYQTGKPTVVTWSSNFSTDVYFQVSLDGGSSYNTVATVTGVTGPNSYIWTPSPPRNTSVYLKIVKTDDAAVYAVIPNPLTIGGKYLR